MKQSASTRRTRAAPPRHLHTHKKLLRDVSASQAPSLSRRLDAIIVPTMRPASQLTGLIRLAAHMGTQLVVLCSRKAEINQVAKRARSVHSARALAVQFDDYQLPLPDFRTSSEEFAAANGGRSSDLSLKRNFGLLLARHRGWRKIIYVDDDITFRPGDLVRITRLLDQHELVGMRCPTYPVKDGYPEDNSVFCHARRLAGLKQDVFVSGGVLGVNCGPQPLPFFPEIYNEDWFFFGEAAAQRRLAKAGDARQKPHHPFDPARACGEEFGDLLAEGLYARIESLRDVSSFREVVRGADASYWSSYIADRRMNLQGLRSSLGRFTGPSCSDSVLKAMAALDAADYLYTSEITAERCVQFLEAWQADIVDWEKAYANLSTGESEPDALDLLGAKTWRTVG